MLRLLSRRVLLVAVTLLLLLAVFLYFMQGPAGPVQVAPRADALWPDTGPWAEETMSQLSLEEKVAQMFAARAYGTFKSADDREFEELVDLVERFKIGGLAFFQGDPMAQATLINELQKRAETPLLISQDMETGAGMRIRQTTILPHAMALGATRNAEYARAAGYVTAREARALGTQQIYAPVADLNNNPDNPIINVRSFGEDGDLVSEMVTSFIRGAQDGRVIPTVKHFPGHGDTDVDSHADLPVLPFNWSRLSRVEGVPFRAAISAGVQSVMVGHLALPEITSDSTMPASLSPEVIRRLRERLGFNGLVVTDAMDMAGLQKNYGAGEAAVRAVAAGVDVLLISEDPYAARSAIIQAVKAGRLDEDEIDDSVLRILRAKEWAGLHKQRLVDLEAARERVAAVPHLALSRTIARSSLTLLRNQNDLLPIVDPPEEVLSITLSDSDDPAVGRPFTEQLKESAPPLDLTTHLLDDRSSAAEYEQLLKQALQSDLVVVPAFLEVRARSNRLALAEKNQAFLNDLVQLDTPVVLVSFGNPYMTMGLDRPTAYVAAYGSDRATQTAAAQAIFGKSGFEGRLPITIPDNYQYGAGLTTEQVAPREGYPEEVGMDNDILGRVDSLMRASIADGDFPGAAVAVGRAGVTTKMRGYGYYTYDMEKPVTPHSVYDLASLTKVVATTTAAMLLYESGKLDLDSRVVKYLPSFDNHGKSEITIRQLLSHSSGLEGYRPFHQEGFESREEVIDAIMNAELEYEPGTQYQYSDLGIITLYLVIEAITGRDFATYAEENIFEPLHMYDTGFRKVGATDTSVVPTERDDYFRNRLLQGEVHDETASLLGGTSGHAGLFSTADDLSKFAYMLLNDGNIYGRSFLSEETIELFTEPVEESSTRALGWDTRSPEGYSTAGDFFSTESFGHTGFTGTSLWIDPEAQLFAILLTNRVYPTRQNGGIRKVRPQFANIAQRAIQGPPDLLLPGAARPALASQ